MNQVVPTYGFKWISKIQGFTTRRTAKLVKNTKHGDILKKDVHYPEKLHDMHNKLPDMVEMMNINMVKKVRSALQHQGKVCGSHLRSRSRPETKVDAQENALSNQI